MRCQASFSAAAMGRAAIMLANVQVKPEIKKKRKIEGFARVENTLFFAS